MHKFIHQCNAEDNCCQFFFSFFTLTHDTRFCCVILCQSTFISIMNASNLLVQRFTTEVLSDHILLMAL